MNDATMKSTVVKKYDPYAPTDKPYTPTPQRWEHVGSIHHERRAIRIVGTDGRTPYIADNVKREHAALIVRAVNSHAELVAALRKLAIKGRVRMAEGGRTVPVGGLCEICKNEWDYGDPEAHKTDCVLDAALAQEQGSK